MAFRNPLQWPVGWERTEYRRESKRKAGWNTTINELDRVTKVLGLEDVQISTNHPVRVDGQLSQSSNATPADPGVAIYFKRKGADVTIACDAYTSVLGNLRSIGLALDYLSRMERDGTSQIAERAFTGFAALPASTITPLPHRDWWVVLGVDQYANVLEVKAAYRDMLKLHHPDAGGNQAEFDEVRRAYEEWKQI